MDEDTWLSQTNCQKMLEFLRGQVTDRKLRLFGVACCRSARHRFTDWRLHRAVDVAERYADGLASEGERSEAQVGAEERAREIDPFDTTRQLSGEVVRDHPVFAAQAAAAVVAKRLDALRVAQMVVAALGYPPGGFRGYSKAEALGLYAQGVRDSVTEPAVQSELLTEVIGNPFRPVCPTTWVTAAAVTVAQDIYDRQDYAGMPLLADLLEEAGCPEQAVLDHCRRPGPVGHVRGCWVIDLVRGRAWMAVIPANEAEYWATVGNLNRLMEAVSRGADVNRRGEGGYTALHGAAENGHFEVLLYLIGQGADTRARLASGETPLDLAEREGHRNAAMVLRRHG